MECPARGVVRYGGGRCCLGTMARRVSILRLVGKRGGILRHDLQHFRERGVHGVFLPIQAKRFPLDLAWPDTGIGHSDQCATLVLFLWSRPVARWLAERPECHTILRLRAGGLGSLHGCPASLEAGCVSACRAPRLRIRLEASAWP